MTIYAYLYIFICMGTVLEFYGIKIRINPRDHNPPHCHIEGKGCKARFNLKKMTFMDASGFTPADLNKIKVQILIDYQEIMAEWRRLHGEE